MAGWLGSGVETARSDDAIERNGRWMAAYGHAQRGEVLALDRNRLRLALWQGTTTTGNLLRSGQGTLVAIHDGAAHYVRLRLQGLPDLPDARHPLQRFEAEAVAVREDTANYADIISAVKFQLHNPEEVLQRWKETLEELRK